MLRCYVRPDAVRRPQGLRQDYNGPPQPDAVKTAALPPLGEGGPARAQPLTERAKEPRGAIQHALWENYIAAGAEAYQQGRYAEAEKQLTAALKEAEALVPAAPRLVTTLHNLAEVYRTQGKYPEAEPLHKRALAIQHEALGPHHLDVAVSLNKLAFLYYTQGKYGAAEPLYLRMLPILERAVGPEHPRLAKTLNKIGTAAHRAG